MTCKSFGIIWLVSYSILFFDRKILNLEKDLHETQLDYFYVSSPAYLSEKINYLAIIEYSPMDFSRIYLNFTDFANAQNKITNLKEKNEKKTQKK